MIKIMYNSFNHSETLQKGSYLLVIRLEKPTHIKIGKKFELNFTEGYYCYSGSALGKNGLTNRLKRHLRKEKKLHWHIDYFLQQSEVIQVMVANDGLNHEHEFTNILINMLLAEIPCPGFGSSDCKCITHFVYFNELAKVKNFIEIVNSQNIIKLELVYDIGS